MPSRSDEVGAVAARRGAPDPVVEIRDPEDQRLADYMGLRHRGDRVDGFFVAESRLVVRRVVRAMPDAVRSLFVTPTVAEALADVIAEIHAPVYVAPSAVLEQVVGFDLHRGALASIDRHPLPTVTEVLAGARRVAVLERVNDHENLGVLFRNAAAFGVDAVLLDAESSDPLYRRAVRVSIGHVCTVPWTRYSTLSEIRDAGFVLCALTPSGDVTTDEYRWPDTCALMLGAEGPGLSDAALAAADVHVRIPMRADVDSLNVATAAAIAFYSARDVSRR
ncbi:MAG: RNA methyltransferase [Actinomycetota bacterium]|nr:RNA methyltransferase [Actinomycetota bacterium]